MVGTPTINNQPYQWVYFTTEASLFWLSACGEGAGDQDWDPGDACAFPPFQYSGCTVAGGGFLTIGAGNSVNYTASALVDGASNSSLSAEINAEGNELKLSLSGDTFADPQGHYCDSRYYHWNSDSRSQIVVFGPVIDITNINDYPVNLEVSWNFTPTTTVGDDDSYSYQSLNASYAESYPCPSAISWPTGDWDELFTICDPIRPDLGCADPLSGTRTFSIDPGHVQHTLMLTTDTQSRVNKTCSDCSAPPPSTASFSGTITFRLGNTGP
jgi:hypothetical protein